jgi:hypothetical protein
MVASSSKESEKFAWVSKKRSDCGAFFYNNTYAAPFFRDIFTMPSFMRSGITHRDESVLGKLEHPVKFISPEAPGGRRLVP